MTILEFLDMARREIIRDFGFVRCEKIMNMLAYGV